MAHLDFIDPGNSGGSVPTPDSPFENIGFRKIVFPCPICHQEFDSRDALFDHRFQDHPYKHPSLLLRDTEITSSIEQLIVIVNPLVAHGIAFSHVSRCYLDGSYIEKDDLISYLAGKVRGLCTIRLENEGVKTTYQLDFDIPDEAELIGVEQAFFDTTGGNVLNLQCIDLFIDMTSRFRTATRYVDGLSNYLYGILAKDQRGGTQLERAEFTIKFNQAVDTLKPFNRPLAQAIAGVVNFNQNVFGSAERLSFVPKARSVMQKFSEMVTGDVGEKFDWKPDTSVRVKKIPLDYATEKLFDWTMMPVEELVKCRVELEHILKSPDWVASDKSKVQMLLAELLVAIGEFSAAIPMVRNFVNDTVLGPWAQRIIDAER